MSDIKLFPLYLTFKVASLATILSCTVGLSLAWILARKQFFGKSFVDVLIMQPLVIPPTVLGYYLLVLLGRASPVGKFLEQAFGLTLVFTWKGAVIAANVASMPLFIRPAKAAIENIDANLENAARLLGKSEWEVFCTITLPLAKRGILAGTILAFARAMGDFGTTLMVAGNIPGKTQTLSLAIYDAVQADNIGLANILVLIMTGFSIAVLWTVNRCTHGRY
ncbi:molybdate ABC transporter permease subunit [Candidatus Poribacteria bacterium]|nr:molybdate ABC transporter permease subunit [Candidatus Poribacteria bacterium]